MHPDTGSSSGADFMEAIGELADASHGAEVRSIYEALIDAVDWSQMIDQLRSEPPVNDAEHSWPFRDTFDHPGFMLAGDAPSRRGGGSPERRGNLLRHQQRAARIAAKLCHGGQQLLMQQFAIDGLKRAVLALDARQRVRQVNPAGRRLLNTRLDPLIKRSGNRVTGLGSAVSPSLNLGFARANHGQATCLVYRLTAANGTPIAGLARLLPLADAPLLGLPAMSFRYLLVIDPPNEINPAALALFGELFRLTGMEQTVLAHLIEDTAPKAIAAALGVGLPTVRTHLQNLRRKTGARSQTELLRLVLSATRAA